MRTKLILIVLGVTTALGGAVLLTTRDDGQSDPASVAPSDVSVTSAPGVAQSTADLLAERIAAIPGFATTCGQEAFGLGADVFDTPDRLVETVAIDALPCRGEILVGMAAASQGVEFTEEQVDRIAEGCRQERPGDANPAPCAVLLGAVSVTTDPVYALTLCDGITGDTIDFAPEQRVICAATYLSLLFEETTPAAVADEVLRFCVAQSPPARRVCVESAGDLLLARATSEPVGITRVEQTIAELTTLRPAVERCRALEDLAAACQTGVLSTLVVQYPMGETSGPQRVELCQTFDEPVRSACVSRQARPDEDFLVPTEG
jgi:hypothetical protein